jgi:hypothetical protein
MTIDVDDASTWPPDVAALVEQCVEATQGSTDLPGDLVTQAGRFDPELRELLADHRLRAYHCTRLLDHEAEDVRRHGLRLLDARLVADRLTAAYEHGYIDVSQRDELMRTSRIDERAGSMKVLDQICLVPSTMVFVHDSYGVDRLLATWGGEAIYWAHGDVGSRLYEVLRGLGRPTIVCVQLDVAHISSMWPSLIGPFLATAAGWPEERGADIFYDASIPGDQVDELWQPGDPLYDRFPELPR